MKKSIALCSIIGAFLFASLVEAQGYSAYALAQAGPCCVVDVVLLIDRGYFVNQSQFDAIAMDMWTGNQTDCMDIRMAAIEFGTNVSTTYWLGNFTTPADALQALRNYTLGPDLGPDHNADLAYSTANTQVLIPANGLRMNATAFTVLFTGADPTSNESVLMDAVNTTKILARSLVVAVGTNYTNATLEQLATSPLYFFQFNTTDNTTLSQNETYVVPAAICPLAYQPMTCCMKDLVFIIDNAYFATLNDTNRTAIFGEIFNSTNLQCPDLRIAIVEYGSNASVIVYLTNFTSPNDTMGYLSNYTLGTDLGPDHNVDLAYALVRDQVFIETNGRRFDANAVVVLVTGADQTNQIMAESEARQIETSVPAVLIVEAIGDNYTATNLQVLATTPNDFFTVPANGTAFDSSIVFDDICAIRPHVVPSENATCCPAEIIYMIDRAYFGTLNTTDQQMIFSSVFNNSLLNCPEVQVAIVEFGSNYSIISYLSPINTTNMTSLMNYTLGPDLGPDHREDLVYPVIRDELLSPMNGRRMNATAVVILMTGADPTYQREAAVEAMLTGPEAILKVLAIGDNYTMVNLRQLASLTTDFVSMPLPSAENVSANETFNSTRLYGDICVARPPIARPPRRPCCMADVVLIIDRAYFANQTIVMANATFMMNLSNETNATGSPLTMSLQQLFNRTDLDCPDIQIAIIEFGTNATVVMYLNGTSVMGTNMTTSPLMVLVQYLENYTSTMDLGTDHNVDVAYALAGSDVLIPEAGRRDNVTAYVILVTGADPTNQTSAESEATTLKANATSIVVAVGENYTVTALEPLASSPQHFFQYNETSQTSFSNITMELYQIVCRNITRPIVAPTIPCCLADVVLLIDRAYFANQTVILSVNGNETSMANESNLTSSSPFVMALQQVFNSTTLICSDIQIAVIEFGTNATVVTYLNSNIATGANMTSSLLGLAEYLLSYTATIELGPGHNADVAYRLAGSEVLTPEYGRRDNVTAFVILVTGADPTNQTAAESEATTLKANATSIVVAVGDNYTASALEPLATSPELFFQYNETNQTTEAIANISTQVFNAVCRPSNVTLPTPAPVTPPGVICHPGDFVIIIDNAFFTVAANETVPTPSNETVPPLAFLAEFLTAPQLIACPEVRIAIIEFGTTTSVITYLTNFTSPTERRRYLETYQLGPFLGPEHNAYLAYSTARSDVLTRGRRSHVPAYVVLVTGATPTNVSATESEADVLKQEPNVTLVVQTVGTNYSVPVMQALASAPQCVFAISNETTTQQSVFNTTEPLDVICVPTNVTTTPVPPVNVTTTPLANVTTPSVNVTTPLANVTTPSVNVTTTPVANLTTRVTPRPRPPIANLTAPTGPIVTPTGVVSIDATAFCFTCQGRTNSRNLFANPVDCHSFFQCFFDNPTTATGILHQCPPGTYFHSDIYVCLPEGPVPCQDQCQMSGLKCWAPPDNCAQFFMCANGASYGQCCPAETRFNPDICACEDDFFCTDTCVLPNVTTPTNETAAMPTFNSTTGTCMDLYGTQYQAVSGQANLFQQIDTSAPGRPPRVTTMSCPPGTVFSLTDCGCTAAPSPGGPVAPISPNQCLLYLPFDTNFDDASIYKFATFPFGNAAINTGSPAVGAGSLYVSGGRIEIPGLEAADFRAAATWCFFFRCDSPAGCSVNGGLLSNNRDSTATQFSILIAELANNSIMARLQFRDPVSSVDLFGDLAGTGASPIVTTPETTTVTTTMTTEASPTPTTETTTTSVTETTTETTTMTTTTAATNVTTNETTTSGPILGAPPVTTSVATGSWHQICVVMSPTATILYLNGSPVQTVPVGGSMRIAQCPYVLGNDQAFGDFTGSIDEVLICESTFTANDVAAHLNGDKATLISRGFIPPQP